MSPTNGRLISYASKYRTETRNVFDLRDVTAVSVANVPVHRPGVYEKEPPRRPHPSGDRGGPRPVQVAA